MTLKGIFSYRNADTSSDYNERMAKVIGKSILDGGTIAYTGTLTVYIRPFVAVSADGMTVISDDSTALTLTNGDVWYIVCLAQHQSSSPAILDMQVITEAAWLSSINKAYFITFAKFDLSAGGFSSVTDTDADYSVSDYSDKLSKSNWRAAVDTFSLLPTSQNRNGDTRVVLATNIPYTWNSTTKTWLQLKTSASQVSFSAYPGILATTVQTAIQELKDNLITNEAGAASILIGNTSVAVTFASPILTTPLRVLLTPRGNIGSPWVTGLSSTGMTINIASAAGATTQVDYFVFTAN